MAAAMILSSPGMPLPRPARSARCASDWLTGRGLQPASAPPRPGRTTADPSARFAASPMRRKRRAPGRNAGSQQIGDARGSAWLVVLALLLGAVGCRPKDESARSFPNAVVVEAMNRGVGFMGQYRYDDAVQSFDEVLRLAPGLTEAQVNLAIARFNRNRKEDPDTASRELTAVLAREPGNLRALYFQAIVLQNVGRAEEAVPILEQVVRARPEDGAAWYLLGLCKQRLQQPAEAEFRQAVRCRPYLYSAHYQLYQAARRTGDEAAAARHLELFQRLRDHPLGETIELPQYNQMGDLALVQPLPRRRTPPLSQATYAAGPPRAVPSTPGSRESRPPPTPAPRTLGGAALADLDQDGHLDVLLTGLAKTGYAGPLRYAGQAGGGWGAVPAAFGPSLTESPSACAVGDFDHDEVADVFVADDTAGRLFRGSTNGTLTEATREAGLQPAGGIPQSALWLDADHDGDLDLFVCHRGAPNQLFNNDGSGGFTNIATAAGVACPEGASVAVVPGDFDRDRDLDLVVLREGRPAVLFLNELLGRYREGDLGPLDIRGELGAAAHDLDGDGLPDLLVLGGEPVELKLFTGDGHGGFLPSPAFGEAARAASTWGPMRGFRVIDLDLDGDLDVACFGDAGHVLLNDGSGRFVLRTSVWTAQPGSAIAGVELGDFDGDLVPDLLLAESGASFRLSLVPGTLTPPPTALAIVPSGIRSRDGRTRSPGSGFGVSLTVRTGLREQWLFHSGQAGGANQSLLPVVLGLGGVARADYVALAWPDGVMQVESALPAGQVHKIAELQRKISSCPVLFAWNGNRFAFVTDFAGVGGLGYFAAPGVAAPPQVLEHVKIEPDQLRARAGIYELRVTEPMEEAAYLDRLELLAIDHPRDWRVFPDERLAIQGPPPTHALLVVDRPVFPVRAIPPGGGDCADALRREDRVYAYEPPLDRRYIGFCRPHALELDFGDGLDGFRHGDRLFLFIQGFIEYPYSQTVYAASQSRIGWEPIRVECQDAEGHWRTVVPDGGVPGGMARMMTLELTGLVPPGTRKLRLTTNLEVFYDQIFVGRPAGSAGVTVRPVPLRDATLRRVGFAREYSPDGRLPLIYDYDGTEATAPFHVPKGDYTRYGPVAELLADFDDRYVIMGPGDEVALRFDASVLAPLPAGHDRSFVLVSHAYCKDMDLYTATPRTLEPLPFRGMSQYPYPATERYPATEAHRSFREAYNTRVVD
jgi:Tfp pilus assembly protein PilF